jgi:membrane associated rhomboid family serine protease
MAIVLFLAVLAFVVYRATTPEEHVRFVNAAQAAAHRTLQWFMHRTPAEDAFDTALRERQKHAFATLGVVVLNAAALIVMTPSRGGSEEALLAWGASFGPRTTNGEWWRLLTAIAVEPTVMAFVIHTAALLYVGRIVERLVGVRAFVSTYLTAGVLAGVWNLPLQPIAIASGSAGAVLGLFGLVAGSWIRGLLRPDAVAIPSAVIRRVAPVAVVLFAYTLLSGELTASSVFVGFFAGVCAGLIMTHAPEAAPSWRTMTYLLASGWALAMVLGISMRSITDVRPAIEALAPLETRTSEAYEAARRRFQAGRSTPTNLIEIIEKTILPELRAEQARIAALDGIPREHEPLVRDAADYLKHRTRSWELRAEGLRSLSGPVKRAGKAGKAEPPPLVETRAQGQARHTANLMLLGRAETEERAALETLQRLTTASS